MGRKLNFPSGARERTMLDFCELFSKSYKEFEGFDAGFVLASEHVPVPNEQVPSRRQSEGTLEGAGKTRQRQQPAPLLERKVQAEPSFKKIVVPAEEVDAPPQEGTVVQKTASTLPPEPTQPVNLGEQPAVKSEPRLQDPSESRTLDARKHAQDSGDGRENAKRPRVSTKDAEARKSGIDSKNKPPRNGRGRDLLRSHISEPDRVAPATSAAASAPRSRAEDQVKSCSLCPSLTKQDENVGKFVGPFRRRKRDRHLPKFYFHKACFWWPPDIKINGRMSSTSTSKEQESSRPKVCDFCGEGYASIPCSYDGCGKKFHYTCLHKANAAVYTEQFRATCDVHKPEPEVKPEPEIVAPDTSRAALRGSRSEKDGAGRAAASKSASATHAVTKKRTPRADERAGSTATHARTARETRNKGRSNSTKVHSVDKEASGTRWAAQRASSVNAKVKDEPLPQEELKNQNLHGLGGDSVSHPTSRSPKEPAGEEESNVRGELPTLREKWVDTLVPRDRGMLDAVVIYNRWDKKQRALALSTVKSALFSSRLRAELSDYRMFRLRDCVFITIRNAAEYVYKHKQRRKGYFILLRAVRRSKYISQTNPHIVVKGEPKLPA